MLVVRATKKLQRLAGSPTVSDDERGSTLLGPWYATVLFWQPRLVLMVNELTLVPVLMPLAPASTLTARIVEEVAAVLVAHQVPDLIIDQEREHMRTCELGSTVNRSVVGVMNEFTRLGEIFHDADPAVGLSELALRLSRTPCGPLYRRNVSPDRELAAVVRTMPL